MYVCDCGYHAPRSRRGLRLITQHAESHRGCSLATINYESPEELARTALDPSVGGDTLNHAVAYRFNTHRTGLEGRRIPGRAGLPTEAPTIGGVHKKFSPEHGLVWAARDTGLSDFPKESAMQQRLGEWNLAHSDIELRDVFFSFQRELDEHDYPDRGTELHQQRMRYRSVSIYNLRDLENSPNHLPDRQPGKTSLNDYMPKLVEFRREYHNNPGAMELLRSAISHIIHQLVYIHYYMFKAGIQHGDLHMGNIKIILDNKGYPIIKVFDFGKSKNVTPGQGTMKDLEYFCCKKAVSGFLETFKRNTWRNDTDEAQLKHYPLHRLCMILLDGIFTKEQIDERINEYGQALIDYLRKGSIPPEKTRMAFRGFSDEIVSLFYQGHVWGRLR